MRTLLWTRLLSKNAEKLQETCFKYIDLNLGVVEELKPPKITLPQNPDRYLELTTLGLSPLALPTVPAHAASVG